MLIQFKQNVAAAFLLQLDLCMVRWAWAVLSNYKILKSETESVIGTI